MSAGFFIGGPLDGQHRDVPNIERTKNFRVFESGNRLYNIDNDVFKTSQTSYTQIDIDCNPRLFVHETLDVLVEHFLVWSNQYDAFLMEESTIPEALFKYEMLRSGKTQLSEQIPFDQIGYFRVNDFQNTLQVIWVPIVNKSQKKPTL